MDKIRSEYNILVRIDRRDVYGKIRHDGTTVNSIMEEDHGHLPL